MNQEQNDYVKSRCGCWLLYNYKLKPRPLYLLGMSENSVPGITMTDEQILLWVILLSKNLRVFSREISLADLKKNTLFSSAYSGFTEYDGRPLYLDLKPIRQYLKAINFRDLVIKYPLNPHLWAYFSSCNNGLAHSGGPSGTVKHLGDSEYLHYRSLVYSYVTKSPDDNIFDMGNNHLINDVKSGALPGLILNRNVALDGLKIVYKGDVVGTTDGGLKEEFEIYRNYILKTTSLVI